MPITFTCRAVLFDLDGTLIDSAARIRRLWQWWAERRGIDFQSLRGMILGRTAVETIRMAAPHLATEDEVNALEAEEVSDMRDVVPYPAAQQLLRSLDGAPWAIVTSGTDRVANARIGHIGLPRPPVLITASRIPRGKPAPDAYLAASQELGIPPADCVVVEDAPVGIAAGIAAGMRVIAIASTNPLESLAGANAVVQALGDIRAEHDRNWITLRIGH
jgi:sugar-phosphatase